MSDRMIPQGYAQLENNLKTCCPILFSFGALNYSFNKILMSSLCITHTKNTQGFRAPPDYVTNLVPWDQRERPWFAILLIPSSP